MIPAAAEAVSVVRVVRVAPVVRVVRVAPVVQVVRVATETTVYCFDRSLFASIEQNLS